MAIAPDPLTILCNRPPEGWHCNLERGHEGSCPTIPDATLASEAYERIAWSLRDHGVSEAIRAFENVTQHLKDPDLIRVIIEDIRYEIANQRHQENIRLNQAKRVSEWKVPPFYDPLSPEYGGKRF